MNISLDIVNNQNEIFENDVVIINLNTEYMTFKPSFTKAKLIPHRYIENIEYWLKERRKLNVGFN